jgi:putative colanic acid biosynthesis UDP-glucose lipid carrier transferase
MSNDPAATVSTVPVDRSATGLVRPYDRELRVITRAIDLAWVALSLRASLLLSGWQWDERYTLLAAVSCVAFYLFAEGCNVYNDRRSAPLRFDLQNILAAWLFSVVTILFVGYVFKVSDLYSRVAVTIWFVATPLALSAWRGVIRLALTQVRSIGYNIRRVAIIGSGSHGERIARTVLDAPWMGLELVGFFDDRAPAVDRLPSSLPRPLLGPTRDLTAAIAEHGIDIIYVALPISNRERILDILHTLSDTTVSLYFVPDTFLVNVFHGRWVRVGDLPAVGVFETPFLGVGGWIKRAEDLLLGGLMTVVAAVPMLLIAVAVKLESSGPILFRQRRYGLDGREFYIWKFRTMHVHDEGNTVTQATRADARVTRVGRFLRRSSLDELPQLLNVLGGSMSIIGPRPHATAHNEYYRRVIPHYMMRHKVRPGISGWAQANGWRGETSTLDKMEARVAYDLWYIRNWSVLLDLRIMLYTVLRVWRSDDVY